MAKRRGHLVKEDALNRDGDITQGVVAVSVKRR